MPQSAGSTRTHIHKAVCRMSPHGRIGVIRTGVAALHVLVVHILRLYHYLTMVSLRLEWYRKGFRRYGIRSGTFIVALTVDPQVDSATVVDLERVSVAVRRIGGVDLTLRQFMLVERVTRLGRDTCDDDGLGSQRRGVRTVVVHVKVNMVVILPNNTAVEHTVSERELVARVVLQRYRRSGGLGAAQIREGHVSDQLVAETVDVQVTG